MRRLSQLLVQAAGIGFISLFPQLSIAQIDVVQTVVSNTNAIGNFPNVPIGAFGYDSLHDRMYVVGFTGEDRQIRLIENVYGTQAPSGPQVVSTLMYTNPGWFMFSKAGDPSENTGGVPTPGSLILNPKTITGLNIQPFSAAWIFDGAAVVAVSGSNSPTVTQKIYRYDLAADTDADGRNNFSSIMTLSQFQQAAGTTATVAGTLARQPAWSGDGQYLYFVDSSSTFGGVWRVKAAGGEAPVPLIRGASELASEPAVISSGGVDTIYFRGSGSNAGGIEKISYDGTTVGPRSIALSVSTINSFLELSSGVITIGSIAADDNGNIYFNDTAGQRKGIYRLDTEGRLSKVVSLAERAAAFQTTPALSNTTARMQPIDYTFTGPSGSFEITQLLYQEATPYNFVAGANVFKTGDFDRDNVVDQDDIALFKQALTVKGTPAPTAKLKFDLNGNGEVSWKDVKILQEFYPFPDGDATMDGLVDIRDLRVMLQDWLTTGQTWTGADFTGDGIVDRADLGVMARNWQAGVNGTSLDDVLSAEGINLVPEPGALTVLAFGALSSLAWRRRGR